MTAKNTLTTALPVRRRVKALKRLGANLRTAPIASQSDAIENVAERSRNRASSGLRCRERQAVNERRRLYRPVVGL